MLTAVVSVDRNVQRLAVARGVEAIAQQHLLCGRRGCGESGYGGEDGCEERGLHLGGSKLYFFK